MCEDIGEKQADCVKENKKIHRTELVRNLQLHALAVKKESLKMVHRAGEGHGVSALSIADIVTTLYFHVLKHDPKNPKLENRDRFLLSKGHACVALYAALQRAGYFPFDWLETFLKMDTLLPGHPDMHRVPGVEMSTGSLGHGLSIGVGMALAARADNNPGRVFVLLGDGESNEGMVWEAAMAGSHYKLDNLIAIIDRNKMQCDGPIESILNTEPMTSKWESFGWAVIDVDGHNITELVNAFDNIPKKKSKPTAIVARTVKGKGVSFMENKVEWHYRAPNAEELKLAFEELEKGVHK